MIKALPTRYNGYHFRSRLEARWAVFFDTLGVTYEYEKEGYDLGDAGWYLPDFFLPNLNLWVEVKGVIPSVKSPEAKKLQALVDATGFHGMFVGPNPMEPTPWCGWDQTESGGGSSDIARGYEAAFIRADKVYITVFGDEGREFYSTECFDSTGIHPCGDKPQLYIFLRALRDGVVAFRSARFNT